MQNHKTPAATSRVCHIEQQPCRATRWLLCKVSLLAFASLGACAGSNGDPDQSQDDQSLYGLGTLANKWPNGVVPVCWQNPADHPELQPRVRGILKQTWSKAANLVFTGWRPCSSVAGDRVAIVFSAEPNYRGNSDGLGAGVRTVTLLSDDTLPGLQHFRYEVIHEFGHALGFAHEMQRPDNWNGTIASQCGVAPTDPDYGNYRSTPNGSYLTAIYDADSVMNYCNPAGYPIDLSAGDIAGASRANAYGPPLAHLRAGELVDMFYLGQNGPGQANGLRVHSLLPVASDRAVSFTYQDVASGYGANDMTNWKVAGDLNGDGRPDLIDTFYLGQNGPGLPSGLRVHTLLSTGPGTWVFSYQDVASGYGANDMTNWKVAGDLNGDGRPDLVDTFYLGQNGPGLPSGLRVHTLLSTGPGTWAFTYQDVASGYGVNDMTNWKVADVNGDGRPDLVDSFFLGVPGGLRIHTLLSTGPGSWSFIYQDVASGYGTNDMTNWKVMDLDGDGLADLVDTYYLGQNGVGQASGLRLHSALSRGDGTWAFGYQDVASGYGANDMTSWKIGGLVKGLTQ